jgi:hypothetical protein
MSWCGVSPWEVTVSLIGGVVVALFRMCDSRKEVRRG